MLKTRALVFLSLNALVVAAFANRAESDCCELPGGNCATGITDEATCLSANGTWSSGLVCDGTECVKRIYVRADYIGLEDGSSWATPFRTFYAALNNVAPLPAKSEIWVATGTYVADQGPFELRDRVKIIGGFRGLVGDEDFDNATTRNANPETNDTVLSGVLSSGGNAQVIVSSEGNQSQTSIESFEITGAAGHAIQVGSGSQASFSKLFIHTNTDNSLGGAGMFVDGSRIAVEGCKFEQNDSQGLGGAVLCSGGEDPSFSECIFDANSCENGGGAVYIDSDSYPLISQCDFIGNYCPSGSDGGAIYYSGGFANNDLKLKIRNCSFWGNESTNSVQGAGGAVSVHGGAHDVEIVNSEFYYNNAGDEGGAIRLDDESLTPEMTVDIVNCQFIGNTASSYDGMWPVQGGAVSVNADTNITNCLFSANMARDDSGQGVAQGGAVMHSGGVLRAVNCTFSANEVQGGNLGGGLLSLDAGDPSLIANCIFWNNASDAGPLESSQIVVPDLDLPATQLGVRNCNIQFLNSRRHIQSADPAPTVTGHGNTSLAPAYVSEFGADGIPGTFDGEDLSLQLGSPCIDIGDITDVPADTTNVDDDNDAGEKTPDIVLNPRKLPGNPTSYQSSCTGQDVDLGAYEFATLDCNGVGGIDLIEIAECDADPECPDKDMNDDGIIDTCQDCDENGLPDPYEINELGADDENANCILDDCEPDCNGNGTPDDLDIATGTSQDINLNGVPDTCDPDCDGNGIPDDYEAPLPADTKGRDFVLAFAPAHADNDDLIVELHFTADVETEVNVTYPMGLTDPVHQISITVKPKAVAVLSLPVDASIGWNPGTVQPNAIAVKANHDVRCVQFVGSEHITDGSLAYPVDALGQEYIAITNNTSEETQDANGVSEDRPQFVVVATRDATHLMITPTADIVNGAGGAYAAGGEFPVTLERGEGFLAQAVVPQFVNAPTPDLTGSIIVSDKPVFVINGNNCATVPSTAFPCDTIFETAHPVTAWGSEYIAANLPERDGTDWPSIYRIVAARDNTVILQDGVDIGTIDRGEFIEQDVTGDHVFSSQGGEPIFVVQFMRSTNLPEGVVSDRGDPATLNLLPVEQFAMSYEFSTAVDLNNGPSVQFPHHFAMILASDADANLGGVTLDNDYIPLSEFTAIGLSGYQVARIGIDEGYHATSSLIAPHYVIVGGWAEVDSYLYPAGAANIRTRTPDVDCNANGIIDACESPGEPESLILYVDAIANGFNDGSDWESAFNSLQDALAAAAGADFCNRVAIHVAQGTYRADDIAGQNTGDRSESFQLLPYVTLRGGYAGLIGPDPDKRDFVNFKTVLSGDIGTLGDPTDNTEHVVVADGVDRTAVLDGFIVLSGYTETEGGGVRVSNGSATIRNCRIEDNRANEGGGVYCSNGEPVILNCRIESNAAYLGGGMSNSGASPIVSNCLFAHNAGLEQTVGGGGGMYNHGNSSSVVTNCTFSDNASDFAGPAIRNVDSNVIVANCILWDDKFDCGTNPCPADELEIHYSGAPGFPTGQVSYCCIDVGDPNGDPYEGPRNINRDPVFQNTSDYRLASGSPCIDAGDNERVPLDVADLDEDLVFTEVTPLDLDLSRRFEDDSHVVDTGNGTAPIVDMGCYEFRAPGLLMGGSGMPHGGAGDYMIPSGSVECRYLNGMLTFQFMYDRPVYSADGDAFVTGDISTANASVDSVTQSPGLDTIEITCTGIANETCVGLSFIVESAEGNEIAADYVWQILEGDVTGDGIVDKYDSEAIKALDGEAPSKDEYRCDLDADGLIEGSDSAPIGDDYAMAIASDGNAVGNCSPEVTSMVSRRTHKTEYFDIEVGSVEPRGGNMQIVFAFDREIRSTDGDGLTANDISVSSGTILGVTPVKTWDQFIVEVENVADGEVFTIGFDAEDASGFQIQVEACWPMLLGDVDGDGDVDATDADFIISYDGNDLDGENFRSDLDADGSIEGASPFTDDLDICTTHENNEVESCGG
ncbi:MAG: hypothetical protein H6818_24125 [Phycisphaerales bacterium]|nr:hypothetical protein [Phycisphaerales bacterium]